MLLYSMLYCVVNRQIYVGTISNTLLSSELASDSADGKKKHHVQNRRAYFGSHGTPFFFIPSFFIFFFLYLSNILQNMYFFVESV